MLPTKAKIAAFVCSGRSRPNVSHGRLKFNRQKFSCEAMMTPTSIPTTPHRMAASMNWRTTRSL